MSLYFDANQLPEMKYEYVAWVDIMGTQISMSKSIKITANFIFKLHLAALSANKSKGLNLYPVMDGFYATSALQSEMLEFLRTVFRSVADEFIATDDQYHRFAIRGGLAYGPVIHGNNVHECSKDLKTNASYTDAILLGLPMVQAYLSEHDAPPFGVFVHESARTFAPSGTDPMHWIWLKWKDKNSSSTWCELKAALIAYLDWSEKRAEAIGYHADRIKKHREMVEQYFEP